MAIALSAQSCTELPVARELEAAGASVQKLATDLGAALRTYGSALPRGLAPRAGTCRAHGRRGSKHGHRRVFSLPPFLRSQPSSGGCAPAHTPGAVLRRLYHPALRREQDSRLCGAKLNRAAIADADEKRTDKFFADARLRSSERAKLEDYRGSGYDRGHLAPAGQMPTAAAMAQSFSLANRVPQTPQHNQGAWRVSVEDATKKYAGRATGDVYVITGPVYTQGIAQSQGIGPGQVRVPTHLFKLVYDEDKHRV